VAAKISHSLVQESHLTYDPVKKTVENYNIDNFIANMDDIIKELSQKSQNISINLDIRNITHINLKTIKSQLYKISGLASKFGVSLKFSNFNPIKIFNPDRCCTWFSGHKVSPKMDLFQLISAIPKIVSKTVSTIQFNILEI